MRWMLVGLIILSLMPEGRSATPPLVERYLHSGDLANGEQALQALLATDPTDDQTRFSLGLLQFVRGLERLGQALHEYGARSQNTDIPFLRLPVPENHKPAPINYTIFRRTLDDFIRDLAEAEATLAAVSDDEVALPLRLADIHLDLDCDGKPTDRLVDILKKLMRQNFAFLQANPAFFVNFDRGDVAWLRAYCHLLMGMLDFYLAFDLEELFDLSADELFANPRSSFEGSRYKGQRRRSDAWRLIVVKEPRRLHRFRIHLIEVAKLNHETWEHIRAERDDEHEWLPNPKQRGVFGMPVSDGMIDAWLAMFTELQAFLEGRTTLLKFYFPKRKGKGLNMKTLLDAPPERFVLGGGFPETLPDKYFSKERDMDIGVLFRVFTIFGNTTAVAYAAWFN